MWQRRAHAHEEKEMKDVFYPFWIQPLMDQRKILTENTAWKHPGSVVFFLSSFSFFGNAYKYNWWIGFSNRNGIETVTGKINRKSSQAGCLSGGESPSFDLIQLGWKKREEQMIDLYVFQIKSMCSKIWLQSKSLSSLPANKQRTIYLSLKFLEWRRQLHFLCVSTCVTVNIYKNKSRNLILLFGFLHL